MVPCLEEGKLLALQRGMRHLGCRALEPVLFLDADARPIFPRSWAATMLRSRNTVNADEPAVVSGPVIFGGMGPVSTLWRNAANIKGHVQTHKSGDGIFGGQNMLVDLRRQEVLEAMLDLPLIWPGDDTAIAQVVIKNGGNPVKSLAPGAAVFTRYYRYPGIVARLRQGQAACRQLVEQSYLDAAPPHSISYEAYAAEEPARTKDEATG